MNRKLSRLSGVAFALASLALAGCGTDLIEGPVTSQEEPADVMQSYAQLSQLLERAQTQYEADPSPANLGELELAAQTFKTFVREHEAELESFLAPSATTPVPAAAATAPGVTAATTYPSTDVPKPIPPSGSSGTTTSSLTVPATGAIIDLDVNIDLTHTFDGDLNISLTSPLGTSVLLSGQNGGSGDDYIGTIFDDEASVPITLGSPPFTGSWIPEVLLSAFDGEDQSGTWTLTVDDVFGGDVGTLNSWSVTIDVSSLNQPPTADPNGPYAGDEGSPVAFDGTGSSDPDGDPLTYAWDFGDGNTGSGPTPSHTYADNGLYDVCLTVTDDAGASHTDCTTAAISNVAPVCGPISVVPDPAYVGAPVAASADFSDPGTADTHTATWAWGDGDVTPGVVNETDGAGTATGDHTYAVGGYLTIELTVTDDDGDSCGETYPLTVIQPVVIDIKPGSDPNSINCTDNTDKAVIPVAILTTSLADGDAFDFDATTVDHTTVTFEGASEIHVNKKTMLPRRHEEDVDGDGDIDLLFHFQYVDTALGCGSTEGTLIGETFDMVPIEGTDAVRMVGG